MPVGPVVRKVVNGVPGRSGGSWTRGTTDDPRRLANAESSREKAKQSDKARRDYQDEQRARTQPKKERKPRAKPEPKPWAAESRTMPMLLQGAESEPYLWSELQGAQPESPNSKPKPPGAEPEPEMWGAEPEPMPML